MHYGSETTVGKGYRPAALIQATLEHVPSPDTFMTQADSPSQRLSRSHNAVQSLITRFLADSCCCGIILALTLRLASSQWRLTVISPP
jgi:hypothetical protein